MYINIALFFTEYLRDSFREMKVCEQEGLFAHWLVKTDERVYKKNKTKGNQ
jgi:hypothetical protein